MRGMNEHLLDYELERREPPEQEWDALIGPPARGRCHHIGSEGSRGVPEFPGRPLVWRYRAEAVALACQHRGNRTPSVFKQLAGSLT